MKTDLKQPLSAGLAQLGIEATGEQVERLSAYLELLARWNRVFNLTAITDPPRMVSHHVLDSLAILPHLPEAGRLLDVGTGAGVPGIPLAIMQPRADWVLLDSNGKKTRFVQQAIAELGLERVTVVRSRVQDYHAGAFFDVVLSRAYASLRDFTASVRHLWSPATRLMTLKTEPEADEVRALREQGLHIDITRLRVPGITAPRSLVLLERTDT
jgi:16S rRNA (guanine527-N7)-methyltransferase